ncbi:hypothetical protein QUF99_00130 [Bacillus sp. DX4.1]|uniref:hypothetical protein n=1 Tax=Bacillus sp. DX4.1 TaxID=3055867 RepID=UPI0025A2B421|nr:hypothetical protein [Bacillus sp. DX4.1]MDM5185916.1 hypothetical protein [Bacillus sp. DX4.1]
MKKSKWIYPSLVIGSILIVMSVYFLFFKSGFDITIKNKTNQNITGLTISDGREIQNFIVPTLHSNEKYKTKIKLKDMGENALKLHYQDKNEKKHEEFIFGYFEGEGKGTAKIIIQAVREDGTLDIKVN